MSVGWWYKSECPYIRPYRVRIDTKIRDESERKRERKREEGREERKERPAEMPTVATIGPWRLLMPSKLRGPP